MTKGLCHGDFTTASIGNRKHIFSHSNPQGYKWVYFIQPHLIRDIIKTSRQILLFFHGFFLHLQFFFSHLLLFATAKTQLFLISLCCRQLTIQIRVPECNFPTTKMFACTEYFQILFTKQTENALRLIVIQKGIS